MTFAQCIDEGEKEGRIRPAVALELRQDYAAALAARTLFGADAQRMAAQSVFSTFAARVAHDKRKKILALLTQERNADLVRGFRDELGRPNPYDGVRALMDSSSFGGEPGAFQIYEAVHGLLLRRLGEHLEVFSRDLKGDTRNKATLTDMVDELFGVDTGNAQAKAMARAWRETTDEALALRNAAGGNTAYKADWGLPQIHDPTAVFNAGFKQWADDVRGWIDRARIIDGRTGNPITDADFEEALQGMYDAVVSDGWSRRDASPVRAGSALANQRMDHRFLIFRDAESWRAYQTKYGEGDAYAAMMAYLDGMARDIGLMTKLGPNPDAGLTFAENVVTRDAARTGDPKAKNRAREAAYEARTMFMLMTGEARRPVNAQFARVMGDVRQGLVAAHLGGAMLSAVTDVGFTAITARYNGLPATGVMRRQLALLNPGNAADRALATTLSLIADDMIGTMSAQQRYLGEVWGGRVTQRLADGVLRASGLSAHTESLKRAFGWEFSAMLARESAKDFNALPKPVRRAFQRYAISPEEWDAIRATKPYEHKGEKLLRPDDLFNAPGLNEGAGQRLAYKVLGMIRSETNFAVPTASLYGRAKLGGRERPGTVAGEILRSGLMYKNFAITLVMTHMLRAARQATWKGRAGYMASLVVTSGVLGALSLQLKEISKGRDPRPMTGENAGRFWLASLYQGGGLGIFGDFLFADQNRFGGSLAQTIAGPVVGLGQDVGKLTIGNIQQLLAGDETQAGRESVDFIGRYLPGGSLWYARLAFERMVLDAMRDFTDPDAGDRFRRIESRYQRDFGQRFWWAPGDFAPSRPPDVSSALAES